MPLILALSFLLSCKYENLKKYYCFIDLFTFFRCNKTSRSSKFKLQNRSKLDVDLSIVFGDKKSNGPHQFTFEPENAILKPDEVCMLTVFANPTKYGSLVEDLMLVVKDNPKIETIKVRNNYF